MVKTCSSDVGNLLTAIACGVRAIAIHILDAHRVAEDPAQYLLFEHPFLPAGSETDASSEQT
ncbi:hypothetical protein [Microseira sp. BLCC-F43]|uniref:hypothetical protein n=1 Tax=Microseira sp. BLCC-F43 TaxID=3153602 RepID=UPI0035B81CF5